MPEFLKEFLQAYTQVSGYNLITKQDGKQITESSYVKMWKSIQMISTKMIAKLLGDDEKMVIDVYSHILEEKEDCQSAIANIFD